MSAAIDAFDVLREEDIVFTRQRARHVASAVGFDAQDQTRIATAVSEAARTVLYNAGGSHIEFSIEGKTDQVLVARIEEQGRGRHDLAAILDGRAEIPTDAGFGLVAARRLMDRFRIQPSGRGGSLVRVEKPLPRHATVLMPRDIVRIAAELAARKAGDPFEELRRQNQELLHTLTELRDRQAELAQLNRELEETNRGVVALYAELDDKADSLRQASELKSRFLSHMSHEFRSPLHSILSLARFLLDRTDGDLAPEQEKQVTFIVKAADGMLTLVNDLLDLAKVEAGKVDVHAEPFEAAELFSTLRGMFRPLVASDTVDLVFDEPVGVPTLDTDEGKLSQILRNFLSNAVKFTARGQIRVSAEYCSDDNVTFIVSDTGIGIAPGDLDRIFEEFTQVENATQRQVKGTGLGLPLSRKLAELLQGSILVQSSVGSGSTFSVTIPRVFVGMAREPARGDSRNRTTSDHIVLFGEDDATIRYRHRKQLEGSAFQPIFAESVKGARETMGNVSAHVIVLDLPFDGELGWEFLAELRSGNKTKLIPLLALTIVEDVDRARTLGADDVCLKPVERRCLLEKLQILTRRRDLIALIIDDDETARYVLGSLLSEIGLEVVETASGEEGLHWAICNRPQVIFLDLAMPGRSGFEVLEQLKADVQTHSIPIVINTSQILDDAARARLAGAAAIMSKSSTSRDTALSRLRGILAGIGVSTVAEKETQDGS